MYTGDIGNADGPGVAVSAGIVVGVAVWAGVGEAEGLMHPAASTEASISESTRALTVFIKSCNYPR